MKTRALVLVGVILGGVAIAAELESSPAGRAAQSPLAERVQPRATPLAPLAPREVSVTISSATLGEDCGESPEPSPAKKASQDSLSAPARAAESSLVSGARARRACEQTSMQLSVRSGADAAAAGIKIKKVELFDENGKLIGALTPRGPSVWSAASSSYQTWDQKSVPGADLMVRYVLSAPDWSKVNNRWDRGYTIKATVTVGGTDKKLEREVYLQGETQLPPGVVT